MSHKSFLVISFVTHRIHNTTIRFVIRFTGPMTNFFFLGDFSYIFKLPEIYSFRYMNRKSNILGQLNLFFRYVFFYRITDIPSSFVKLLSMGGFLREILFLIFYIRCIVELYGLWFMLGKTENIEIIKKKIFGLFQRT